MDVIDDASRIRCIHGKKNRRIVQNQCFFERHNRKKMQFKAKKSIETNTNDVCIVYLSETIDLYFSFSLSFNG